MLTVTPSFLNVFFNFYNIQGNVPIFRLTGQRSYFNDILYKICTLDFAVYFCFRCKFSFHEMWQLNQVSHDVISLTNQFFLLAVATDEFSINNRLRQIYLICALFLYYIKQIGSMLPCVCWDIDHKRVQTMARTLMTHSAIASFATFFFLPHFDVICDLLLNRHRAPWNRFVEYFIWI